jgi:anti-sigma factor RsiW
MDTIKPTGPTEPTPITQADLHAYVDQQLTPARRTEVEQYLSARPDEQRRVQAWQQHNEMMRSLLDPVLDEPLPLRLRLRPDATVYPWRGLAAGVMIAAVSASSAWFVRGTVDADAARLAWAPSAPRVAAVNADGGTARLELTGFARRAAVAHVVYSPDVRRPVEVGADQEQQLVAWLSKRLGSAVRPPSLQLIGYELIGGRLLPGDSGPVAQFMYHDGAGQRLTLYVTREAPKLAGQPETAFRFGQDGPVNVFYWVDKNFGYAISGGADRQELLRVSQEVYRQLAPG